jgi:putative transposase
VGDLGRDDRRWPPVASAPLTIEITIYGWSTRSRASARTGTAVSPLHAHSVIVTKHRPPGAAGLHLKRPDEATWDTCPDLETGLQEFNGEPSLVHPLMSFPPKVALSRLASSLNDVSSRRMRQEFPDLYRHHLRASRLWPGSYSAGQVGGAPSVLHQDIQQQTPQGHARA